MSDSERVDQSAHRLTGGCLCGAVRYAAHGALRNVVYCHCEQCRRTSGHYVAATNVADADLELTTSDGLRWFDSSAAAKRGFCGLCGSSLFWKRLESDTISVMAGSLDDKQALIADRHIFVDDKASYYAINDGLPCFAQAD